MAHTMWFRSDLMTKDRLCPDDTHDIANLDRLNEELKQTMGVEQGYGEGRSRLSLHFIMAPVWPAGPLVQWACCVGDDPLRHMREKFPCL